MFAVAVSITLQTMLNQVLDLAEQAMHASTPFAASDALCASLKPMGISYFQSRLYRRPSGRLTSQTHWQAGGIVQREARPGWVGSASFDYICFTCNPLLQAIRETRTSYRFSDFAPPGANEFAPYWDALGEAGIREALCATAYGAGRATASFHIGMDDPAPDPAAALAIQTAALIVAERMIAHATDHLPKVSAPVEAGLSVRERDALMFVAEGKTDWEIATIMGVAESTARFHVDNARRKLGAVNRAHAVARFLATAAGAAAD